MESLKLQMSNAYGGVHRLKVQSSNACGGVHKSDEDISMVGFELGNVLLPGQVICYPPKQS